jgi:cytochrome c5
LREYFFAKRGHFKDNALRFKPRLTMWRQRVSSAQNELLLPHNIIVMGVLLFIAIMLGEVVVPRMGADSGTAMQTDSVNDVVMRLRPVVMLSEMAANPMSAGAEGVAAAQTPDKLYASACQACHMTGAAGAPKMGDIPAWSDRVAKGLDTLVSNAINGIGAMPARGGSQLDDDQIRVVVEYILEQSR